MTMRRHDSARGLSALILAVLAVSLPVLGEVKPNEQAVQLHELARQWEEDVDLSEGVALVRSMPEDGRMRAAELIGADPRPESRLFGAAVFYRSECLHPLLRILTKDAEHGDPRIGQTIGWSMMHATEDKSSFVARFYVERTRQSIEQVETLEGEERASAVLQLCGGKTDCGLADIRLRLEEMEASVETATKRD